MKCTRQRCRVVAKTMGIAASRLTRASEMTNSTPRSPRRVRSRKIFAQNGSTSLGPTARSNDFPYGVGVYGNGDYSRNRNDAAGLANFHVPGVDPYVRPIAFERLSEESVRPFVDLITEPRDWLFEIPDMPTANEFVRSGSALIARAW